MSAEPRLFLLEIGTEELPPNDVASAGQQVCISVYGLIRSFLVLILYKYLKLIMNLLFDVHSPLLFCNLRVIM